MEVHEERLDDLRCAIVEQAAKDYLFSKKVLYIEGSGVWNRESVRLNRDCIRFFKSNWYKALMHDLDGDILLSMLDKEFEEWCQDEEAVSKFISERSRTRKRTSERA